MADEAFYKTLSNVFFPLGSRTQASSSYLYIDGCKVSPLHRKLLTEVDTCISRGLLGLSKITVIRLFPLYVTVDSTAVRRSGRWLSVQVLPIAILNLSSSMSAEPPPPPPLPPFPLRVFMNVVVTGSA